MSWEPETVVRGDKVTLLYQLKENGAAKDITGMTFKFAVKDKPSDTSYKLGPVDGAIDDAAEGKFGFTLDDTVTDVAPFRGVFEVAMYDGTGDKTTLTPPGGADFRIIEDIIA